MNTNIIPHSFSVTTSMREKLKGHPGRVIWFTGLSGSGKSTIAHELDLRLNRKGIHTYILDGDNIRSRLNSDLGFSDRDRAENIRRIAETAALFADAGIVVITAFISPFRAGREHARGLLPRGRFIEVFVNCPLETAEARDPKGLYKKARRGEIPDFTGINSPYEEPLNPEIIIDSGNQSVDEAVEAVIAYLNKE
ncbi:MAG: adenylyl-sulfate kinase [Spirochaetales bacterium]|uniref:Adenylyl-sulfate kinase n=1 Tax=Candidatus Thalassospirochaeta sargassi TaxID=3119039 RepID=A0AAJ1IBF1_9SPIO|nr:adenylyl-sulfate kinase [Spirochaetales bacterium]